MFSIFPPSESPSAIIFEGSSLYWWDPNSSPFCWQYSPHLLILWIQLGCLIVEHNLAPIDTADWCRHRHHPKLNQRESFTEAFSGIFQAVPKEIHFSVGSVRLQSCLWPCFPFAVEGSLLVIDKWCKTREGQKRDGTSPYGPDPGCQLLQGPTTTHVPTVWFKTFTYER